MRTSVAGGGGPATVTMLVVVAAGGEVDCCKSEEEKRDQSGCVLWKSADVGVVSVQVYSLVEQRADGRKEPEPIGK